jgi:cellulose synthase/poly-beta-1,6-N-acetylglucosamine synthase-like glycosyltransferase/peptidoglycan/xylan/chitin deacetylase (PgdA/CDA1 family)/spore germination protein YaaH
LIFVALVWFVRTLLEPTRLPLPATVVQGKRQLKALQNTPTARLQPRRWQQYLSSHNPVRLNPTRPIGENVRLGFYAGWDANSLDSLRAHAHQLTHVAPEWFSLTDVSGQLSSDPDPRLLEIAAAQGLIVLPVLNNLAGDSWQPEAVEGLLNGSAEARTRFIEKFLDQIVQLKVGGVLLDWQDLDPAYQPQITAFISSFSAAFHARQKEVWLSIPLDSSLKAFDLNALSPQIDRFVAQMHDETSERDEPGPIASQDWFDGWLRTLLDFGEPSQWVVSLGSYGYAWTEGKSKAEEIGFIQALGLARAAEIKDLPLEGPSYNPHFSYLDSQTRHTVWFLDAITFLNQARFALQQKVGGLAINRLGTEDPHLWSALTLSAQANLTREDLTVLEPLPAAETVAHEGEGEFLTVALGFEDGRRNIRPALAGRFSESYQKMPQYPTVNHAGHDDERAVALTFDDGPDSKWTPQILDILRSRGVPAAFFLLGSQAEKNPALVQRILEEGHQIGNHTYFHPDLSEVAPERVRLELNVTQLLLQSLTGHSTTLFRPPYNADSSPRRREELLPIQIAQDLGYVTVAENIDPEDWARPGSDIILQRVKQMRHLGQIVLLHDAGGDRSQTVEALPQIIEYLQARGDRIVPVSELIHLRADQVMPKIPIQKNPLSHWITGAGFRAFHWSTQFLWAFMMVATALVFGRTVLVAWLATRPKTTTAPSADPTAPVSIIMAAYNEEKVVQETLHALLRTDYAGTVEVIVVDDGSRDQTAAVVERLAAEEPRLRLIRQKNAGKSRALIAGLAAAHYDWIVFLDADTHFQNDTLRHLTVPLQDPGIGAVSGRARVGNLRNWLTRFQDLEYTCGFNLDRQAYHVWNCITVAPGAISALRRSALEQVGGLSTETLAEDTDLTLALHRQGYRIVYAPLAVAWTEAPETLRNLMKQRFRWAFGTLQCLWKHRDLMFNPKYRALAWFSLPGIWFFQIILVACVPLIDALLLISLLTTGGGPLLGYFFLFLLLDLLTALLACAQEKEKITTALLILPMRFLYRPLLSWVVWRALYQAMRGALVGWGKFERSATIQPYSLL